MCCHNHSQQITTIVLFADCVEVHTCPPPSLLATLCIRIRLPGPPQFSGPPQNKHLSGQQHLGAAYTELPVTLSHNSQKTESGRGQDKLVTGQDKLVTGQDKLVTGQDKLVIGQDERDPPRRRRNIIKVGSERSFIRNRLALP